MYKYGIDLTAATLEQYAYANGVEKSVSEMTQAEKAQLRLLAILDQSKVAWGDLANTINSPANQLRMLKNNFKEVGTVLGQLFIPIMQKTLPWINGLTIAIKRLLGDIASILGIELKLNEFGQGFSDTIDEDTEALDDLNKSMKETKKGIREFDELKVIGGDNSKAGSGLADQIDLTQQILDATAEYERVWDEAYDRMQSKAEEIANALSGALDPIRKIVEDFHIGDFFKAGEDTSQLVISIFDFFSDAINSVDWNALGKKIGEFIEGIQWGEILKSIASPVWSAIQGAFDLWQGSFSVAPFETAIITAFALLKFTGLGSTLSGTITTSITKWFKEKGVDKNFLAKAGIGAISIGLGLSLTIDNVKNIQTGKYAKNSLQSMSKSVISSLLLGAGATAVAAAMGATGGALALVFAVTFAATAIINFLAAKFSEPNEKFESEANKQKREWAEKLHLDNIEVFTSITLKEKDVQLQTESLKFYADKVKELSDRFSELTDSEKTELKFYSDELVKALPGIADSIDKVTGAYTGEKEALDKLIESQIRQIELSAYSENLEKLYSRKAQMEMGGAQEMYNEYFGKQKELRDIRKYVESHGVDFVLGLRNDDEGNAYREQIKHSKNLSKETKKALLEALTDGMKLRDWLSSDLANSYVNVINDWEKINEQIDFYTSKYTEIAKTNMGEGNESIVDGLNDGANAVEKSKLPKAIEKTMGEVDKAIQNGEKVALVDFNDMKTSIDKSFAGLKDGSVPNEVETLMDKIKDAIINGKPELVQYMADLKIAMEEAFVNSHAKYDENGDLIWDLNGAGTRLGQALNSVEAGLRSYANGGRLTTADTRNIKTSLAEIFTEGVPEVITKELSNLDEAITKGSETAIRSSLKNLREIISEEARAIGYNLPEEMATGVYAGTEKYVESVYQMSDAGHKAEKGNDKINSPSKVYRQFGLFNAEGMALGFLDGIPTLKSAMGAIASTMQSVVSGMTLNVPSLNLGGLKGFNARGNYQNGSTSLYEQMASRYLNGDNGQTEVVFRVEGDPYGLFKVVREQNNSYYKRTGRSAF